MAMLADIERLFERIFERSTARLFRAHLQAVQLERRVERSMERARSTEGGRTVVPARFRVRLNPEDLVEVAAQAGGADVLAGRLADAALAFARAHGYHLPGRPSVALVSDPAVQRGVIEVDAVAVPPRAPAGPGSFGHGAGAASPAPDMPAIASPVPDMPAIAPRAAAPQPAQATTTPPVLDRPAPVPDPVAPAPAASQDGGPAEPGGDPRSGGIRGNGTETLVFRRPAPAPARAILRVTGRDGSERTIEVDGTPLTVGRASDNALVLGDPRVSRHHARLQARRGTLVLTDLGSTNGSRVNGVRVDECALGVGDRVVVGDTVLVIEQLPG
jgi:hypothetical protein